MISPTAYFLAMIIMFIAGYLSRGKRSSKDSTFYDVDAFDVLGADEDKILHLINAAKAYTSLYSANQRIGFGPRKRKAAKLIRTSVRKAFNDYEIGDGSP